MTHAVRIPRGSVTDQRQAGFPRLLGDVGGTNARWAWQSKPGQALVHQRSLPVADYASIGGCIATYRAQFSLPPPRAVAFGIATAITGDTVRMTNRPWSFSIDALRASLGVERLCVLNDFEALALSVPAFDASSLAAVGGGHAVEGATLGVIGAGTGLGVSGLVSDGRGGWRVIVGEGGHVTLAAATAREAALLALLRERFGHASAERALSGPGLVNLYEAACALEGEAADQLTLAQVMARAFGDDGAERDPRCAEALFTFGSLLGNAAGSLALTLGARGGVYIGGGIVPRLGERFAQLPFRARSSLPGSDTNVGNRFRFGRAVRCRTRAGNRLN